MAASDFPPTSQFSDLSSLFSSRNAVMVVRRAFHSSPSGESRLEVDLRAAARLAYEMNMLESNLKGLRKRVTLYDPALAGEPLGYRFV